MYYNKKIISFIILCAFFIQLAFSNILSTPSYAAETVSGSVDESVEPTTQSDVEPKIESKMIGDVNGDGNRNSIDFALMRMVLLGMKDGFPIINAKWASDADGNGVFNSIDFAYMRMVLLSIIKELPAEKMVTPTPVQTLTPTPSPTSTPTPTVTHTIPTATPTFTGDLDTEKPTVPQDFHYVTKTESLVILSWKASTDNVGVIGYDVFVDDKYYETVTENAIVINDLEENTTYGFSVKAKDAAGNYSDSTDYIVLTTMEKTAKSYKFKKVDAGSSHTIALNEDGTVWAWGKNICGQLGNNSEFDSCVPVRVNDLTDIIDIAAGAEHSLALRGDGTVWAWGANGKSQCGVKYDNSNILTPIKVGGIKNVKQIGAGFNESYILLEDGTLWQCGYNSTNFIKVFDVSGDKNILKFGDGYDSWLLMSDATITVFDNFVRKGFKLNGLSDVEDIIGGWYYSLAIKKDGTVWYIKSEDSFIQIPNIKNIKQVSGNYREILLLQNDGTLLVVNSSKMYKYLLGEEIDLEIENFLYNIEAIGSGYGISYAINEDGEILVWGERNREGEFGNGILSQNYPNKTGEIYEIKKEDIIVNVYDNNWGGYELSSDGVLRMVKKGKCEVAIDSIPNVRQIYKGNGCFYILMNDGTVWSWGNNYYGQLGDGTTTEKNHPVKVKNLDNIIKLKMNGYHYLALAEDGTVWSWGQNQYGELGYETTMGYQSIPKKIDGLPKIVDTETTNHTLALAEDGTVWAWGKNNYGQLGDGTTIDRYKPDEVANLSGVISIAIGDNCSLALKDDGTAWGWGSNSSGVLGIGNNIVSYTPSKIIGLNNIVAIEVAGMKSKFITQDLSIWECGGAYVYQDTPVRVTMENDANLRYITINNSFLEAFDEDITEYNVILPPGTTTAPNVGIRTYNPYATYNIDQPDTVDGIAIIEVTAWDGETKKTYKIKFNQPSYAEYKESYHFGESGTGASGNFSRTYTDMTADAPGFELTFSRTYNSKNMKIGGFGRGWTFGFESKIEDTGYIGVKQVTLPDGSVNLFEWDGSEYVAENSRNKLTMDSEDTFLLTTKDQYTYHYDEYGHLEWMKDRNGNIVSIDVDSNGKVKAVTDQAGRIYNVTYENGFIR